MYHSYFGMQQRPFAATPPLDSFYPAACQEEAFATLNYAITEGHGIALLTAAAGLGKSLICHRLARVLASSYTIALITNTNMGTVRGLLQAILYDLALPHRGMDEQELRLTLTDYLLGKYAGGGRMVLVIDEAQNLTAPLLEELRMIGNLEGPSDKLFQIVLAGHTRMHELLGRPELETLNQRIGARATLQPFSDEETATYIAHQLHCAGARTDLFTTDAISAVYEATAGIPRRINQLCDRCLLNAFVAEMARVDLDTVERATRECATPTEGIADESTSLGSSVTMVVPTATGSMPSPSRMAQLDRVPSGSSRQVLTHEALANAMTSMPRDGYAGDSLAALEDTRLTSALSDAPAVADTRAIDIPAPGAVRSSVSLPADEEVVDLYATLDSERAGRMHQMKSLPRQQSGAVAAPRTTVASPSSTPAMQVLPIRSAVADADPMPIAELPPAASVPAAASDPQFVESSDNPAVHEVGAGVVEEQLSTTPPVLVIEPATIERTRDNRMRVDRPQPTAVPAASIYQRLFSKARRI